MKIFADDTKVYSAIKDEGDCASLQDSIDKLVQWTEDWLVKFNSEKCKFLHLGRKNKSHKHVMKEGSDMQTLQTTEGEKYLGVIVDPDLNFEKHIVEKVKKANSISGLLMRTITFKTKDIMVPLFKTLIRPILEYANATWCPYLRKHIDMIEGVQRRFTHQKKKKKKKIIGMGNLEYEDRLNGLRLPSLEYRRTRGDMIEVYKIKHEYYDPINTSTLFKYPDSVSTSATPANSTNTPGMTTRGHEFKLMKSRSNTRTYQEFFTNRTANLWNNLPREAVNAKALNAFKNHIDKSLKDYIYSTTFGEPKPN